MIYQPEVAARAIVYVSEHPRRELYVGWPTLEAIIGNKIVPGFADYELAKTGYKGQLTDEPEAPNREDNLWKPLPGDHGAHGPFNALSHNSSPQVWLSENRWAASLAGLVIGVGTALLLRK